MARYLAELIGRDDTGATLLNRRPYDLVVTDSSGLFTMFAALSWSVLVLTPIIISITFNLPVSGLPLIGVALWLGLLRTARWLSPAAHADSLIAKGHYAEALAMCERSLAITGSGAWVGRRRLVWLNRRVAALLGMGAFDAALLAAVDALEASADPETIANCAVVLLRLNRYDMAIETARVASVLTHDRSVRANATLAWAMLARGLPAEAEALAGASLADIQALTPYVRRENHTASLSALCQAQRALGLTRKANDTLKRLRRIARHASAVTAVILLEEAGVHADEPAVAAEFIARAHAADPAYTGWYLTQPIAQRFQTDSPAIATLAQQSFDAIEGMSAAAPEDGSIQTLLRSLRAAASPRPIYQSSLPALMTQVVTLSATLALLLLWMWRFFISQSL